MAEANFLRVAAYDDDAPGPPGWIVGCRPCEPERERAGYVVHLEEPRFVLRWYVGERDRDPFIAAESVAYAWEAMDLTLCELVLLDQPEGSLVRWLHEAAMQVGSHLSVGAPQRG